MAGVDQRTIGGIDQRAVSARDDETVLEDLIRDCTSFILRTTYRTTGTYVDQSDDRWSVSLSAFYEAVRAYEPAKGGFLPFASRVIRRRLLDQWKRDKARCAESTADPSDFWDIPDRRDEQPSDIHWEIQAMRTTLAHYGIDFFDVARSSPKAEKTKEACARIIRFLADRPLAAADLWRTRRLPVAFLAEELGLPRKIMERHRMYIIAAVEILTGDYPALQDYFRHMRTKGDGGR